MESLGIIEPIQYLEWSASIILITGSSDAKHLDNLDRVLKKLSASGLKLRLDKWKFMALSVTYLGHQIDLEDLHPTEDKIWAIRDAHALCNVTELKAFLGLLQFYSGYVPNVADKLGLLYHLLQKGVSWNWETDHFLAFQQVKESLQTNHILVFYDPKNKLILTCDASQYGVGAVLFHIMPNSSEKPVAYASWTLLVAQKNYNQLDKEGLGIILRVKTFHQYLLGWTFRIVMDHKPLISLFSLTRPILNSLPPRIMMSSYDYSIMYKLGTNIVAADPMSCLPLKKIYKSRHRDASFT